MIWRGKKITSQLKVRKSHTHTHTKPVDMIYSLIISVALKVRIVDYLEAPRKLCEGCFKEEAYRPQNWSKERSYRNTCKRSKKKEYCPTCSASQDKRFSQAILWWSGHEGSATHEQIVSSDYLAWLANLNWNWGKSIFFFVEHCSYFTVFIN